MIVISALTVAATTIIAAIGALLIQLRQVRKDVRQVHDLTNSMKDALVASEKQLSYKEGGEAEKLKSKELKK